MKDTRALLKQLVRIWPALHMISLLAVVAQPTTPPILFARYSRTSLLVFAGLLLTAPLVFWFVRRMQRDADSWALSGNIPGLLLLGCMGALFGVWWLNTGPTLSYLILRLYLSLVFFTVGLWALTPFDLPAMLGRRRIPAMLVGATALVTLLLSARYPGLLWTDEGFVTSVSLAFAQTGRPVVPTFGDTESGPIYSITHWLMGHWFSLFGVSLSAGRVFLMLVGLAAMALIYVAGRRAYGEQPALLALPIGIGALLGSNFIRADITVSLFMAGALAMYIHAQQTGKAWPHLIVGLLMGYSPDGHPSAGRFAIGFGVAYIVEYAIIALRARKPVLYWPLINLIMGGLIGAGAYVLLYSTLNPESFGGALSQAGRSFTATSALSVLGDQFALMLVNMPLLFGIAGAGVIIGLRLNTALDRLLIIVVAVNVILLMIAYGYVRQYYLMHSAALMTLLGMRAFSALNTALMALFARQGAYLAALAMVTAAVGGDLAMRVQLSPAQDYSDVLAVADQIRRIVPRETVFVGLDPLYLRMYDYPSFMDMNTVTFVARKTGQSELATWEALNPQAVLIAPNYPIAPLESLLQYVERRGMQGVACWESPIIGRMTLYRVPPPDAPFTTLTSCAKIRE